MLAHARKLVLFGALAGTVALVALDSGREGASTGRVPPTGAQPGPGSDVSTGGQAAAPVSSAGRYELPDRPLLGKPQAELFGPHSRQPPAPKIAVEPPAPTAPSMPYRYAGKLIRDGLSSTLLTKGDTVFPIKEGDTLDGAYRVESIGETQITLLYLPLKQRESIPAISMLPAAPPDQPDPPTAVTATPSAPAVVPTAQSAAATALATAAPVAGVPGSGGETPKSGSGPAQLLWEGPQQVKLGARFEVALKVTSGQPLQASPMQLRFDPAFLEFVAAKPGKFFGGGRLNFVYRAGPDGSIFVGASSPSAVSVSDAELLVLTFKPLKTASAAELSIASVNLQGPAGRAIALGQPEAFRTAITP